jgi:hypothetical protein
MKQKIMKNKIKDKYSQGVLTSKKLNKVDVKRHITALGYQPLWIQ